MRMKKIVFFDIDGTLVSRQNYIPESAKRAIKELKKQGILPVIATGRAPLLLEEVRAKLDIESYISMNGQYVVLEGKTIFANPLDESVVTRFTEVASKYNNGVMLCGDRDVFSNALLSLAKRSSVWNVLKGIGKLVPGRIQLSLFRRAMKKPPKPEEYAGKPIYQIILEASSDRETFYREEFSDLNFTRSNAYTLDVISSGISKASGIEVLIEKLGIKREDTYAFGDSLNDLEMLKYVGTGVAMGNGLPEVKNAADLVTADVTKDGIEKALKELALIP